MKLFILLFLFIAVTCQDYQLPLNRRLIARQGDPGSNEPFGDQVHEKLKILAKKYILDGAVDPDPQTLLVPYIYKPVHVRSRVNGRGVNLHQQNSNPASSRFTNPGIHTRFLINESAHLRQVAQADHDALLLQKANAERAIRLAQADKEALSKLSDEDRQFIESKLTPTEREALLVQLENGQLDDLLPREENRFGGFGSSVGGFSGAAAQIGASAGGYIGGKLAGSLGAKLGAAAGAYLGAAAASRFVKKTSAVSEMVSNIISDDAPKKKGLNYGATIGGFGALTVNNN